MNDGSDGQQDLVIAHTGSDDIVGVMGDACRDGALMEREPVDQPHAAFSGTVPVADHNFEDIPPGIRDIPAVNIVLERSGHDLAGYKADHPGFALTGDTDRCRCRDRTPD